MRKTELTVTKQGAVRVHCADVFYEAPGVALIHIDLDSKRAQVASVGFGEADDPPVIVFVADEHTLYLDEPRPRESWTWIELPEFRGWRIYGTLDVARYSCGFTLYDPRVVEQ